MGEIADMMLDGTLCAACGVYLDQEPAGYPVYCGACEEDQYRTDVDLPDDSPMAKKRCPICGARKRNVLEHAKAKHPAHWREMIDTKEAK